MTWGLGKGETGQAGAGGLRAGTRLPSSLHSKGDPLLYKGSWALHANKMSLA